MQNIYHLQFMLWKTSFNTCWIFMHYFICFTVFLLLMITVITLPLISSQLWLRWLFFVCYLRLKKVFFPICIITCDTTCSWERERLNVFDSSLCWPPIGTECSGVGCNLLRCVLQCVTDVTNRAGGFKSSKRNDGVLRDGTRRTKAI